MATGIVHVERQGEVALLRIDRPPANAIEMELGEALRAAFDGLLRDAPDARRPGALVLTGSERFFSGGLDLKRVPAYTAAEQRAFLRLLNRLIAGLYACPMPVVGAVNGHAIAGGLVLALATDYRVGPTSGALFGLTEARVGIPFPAAPLAVIQAELSPADLRYTALQARNFGPDEAHARGILDELQPPGAVLERALEVARDLAGMPADAYRRIKHQVRGAAIARLEELVAADTDPMLEDWLSPQAAEASAAVLDGPRRR
jgi:enoyl-CoA hydratase